MTREEKYKIVAELKEKFNATDYFYITDAAGLSVADVDKFRRHCFKMGIEYKVVKNSLIKKALQDKNIDFTPFNKDVFKGFSGILFGGEIGNLPAKALKDFRKTHKMQKPLLKGASIDGALFIGEQSLDTLASLKSKRELVGDVIGLLQSPAQNVVSALKSGGDKLAGIVKTLSEKEQ